ncbi:MAG: carboxypeptidase-like regulatory domain-containing protein [Pirellulaceae bacterium]
MKQNRFLRLTAAWLACVSLVTPSSLLGAEPVTGQQVMDVALQPGGLLKGQVVDAHGAQLSNTKVIVIRGGQALAAAQTDDAGRFQIPGLQGGVYQIASAGTSGVVRTWTATTAPPAARDGLMLVSNDTVVRGQCGSCGQAACGGGCGAVSYGPACGYDPCGSCGTVCGGGCGGCGGGGLVGFLTNPLVIGAGIATAIAVPIALSNNDDDNNATPTM